MRSLTIPICLTALLLAALPGGAAALQEDDDAFLRVAVSEEGEDRIHRLRARVRHTTVIVLPAGENILDFVVGDSEYWHLTGAANVAFLKPLSQDAATNIALVCESGRIYSFLAAEKSDGPPNRVVFCLFAEDAGLLPDNMFTRMLERTRRKPDKFADYASRLFGAMSTGGDVGFESVAWFNGGLFDDDTALPLDRSEIDMALKAAALDWSEIDPSILGTLFERGLDPDKRSQLGAHYTDSEKIMRIVEPVIVRPLLAESETAARFALNGKTFSRGRFHLVWARLRARP